MLQKVIEFEIQGIRIEGIRVSGERIPRLALKEVDNGQVIQSDEERNILINHWDQLPASLAGKKLATRHWRRGFPQGLHTFRFYPSQFYAENWITLGDCWGGDGLWDDELIILRRVLP